MAWVRLEDGFTEHPKVMHVGGDAAWLFVCSIAYCNRNLTDGFIPVGALGQLSDRRNPRRLATLLATPHRPGEAPLWEPVDGGWAIHDYLKYNPTRDEVLAARAQKHEQKAEAGRKGGIASGVARRKHDGSSGEADTQAEGQRNEAPIPIPIPSSNSLTQHGSRGAPPSDGKTIETILGKLGDGLRMPAP